MARKREKPATKNTDAEEILKRHGFEVATDNSSEPIDYPEATLFDDDILEKNIVIKTVKRLGERETKYGLITDYLLQIVLDDSTEAQLRTNHAYVFGVVYRLDKYKRPMKARLMKGKGEKGRYYLTGWVD